MKTTAIVLGGLTQAVAFAVLLVVVQPPQLVYLSAPAVGGVAGALASDRFQSEYVDVGGAGVVGTLLSLEVVMVTAWPNTVSLPPDLRIDVTFLTLLFGVGALILVIPITVLASAVVGHVTVIVWEMQTTS